MKPTAAFAIVVLLASCSRQASLPSAPDPARDPQGAPANVTTVDARAPAPVRSTAPASDVLLRQTCGESSIAIVKNAAKRALNVADHSGAVHDVADPPEMKGYVPRGLACATSTNGAGHGFIVEYGEEPYGCQFCEWRFIVDGDGNVVTHADPPVLTDSTRPDGQQQYPNQREYASEFGRLQLVENEMHYVPRGNGVSP